MQSKEKTYDIMHKITLIRRILNYGYDSAYLYTSNIEDELFTESRKDNTRQQLIEELHKLRASMCA